MKYQQLKINANKLTKVFLEWANISEELSLNLLTLKLRKVKSILLNLVSY